MPLLERLDVSGGATFTDSDWTDPANDPPGYARPFVATSDEVVFAIIGKADTSEAAVDADVGAMTVDAWVGWERPEVLRASGRPAIRRGLSVVEASTTPLLTRIAFRATDANKGDVGHLHLDLASITVPAIDVVIISGGRPL
jgi:hypothetical protein